MDRRWDRHVVWLLYGMIFTVNAISLALFGAADAVVVMAAITGLGAVATFFLLACADRKPAA